MPHHKDPADLENGLPIWLNRLIMRIFDECIIKYQLYILIAIFIIFAGGALFVGPCRQQ